jgi:hypothetical protein
MAALLKLAMEPMSRGELQHALDHIGTMTEDEKESA